VIDIVVGLNLTSSRPKSIACLHYGTCLIYDNHSVNKAVTFYLSFHIFCKLNILNISALGIVGPAVVRLVKALQVGSLRVQFPTVSLEFFSALIFPATLWPCG
jgi:hypothetical protein